MKQNFILLIEDDSDVREALAEILLTCGYSVVEASHGQEALEKLSSLPVPSLVFLDAMMPVMDGPTFFAEFRKNENYRNVPVVLFSAVGHKITLDGLAGRINKPGNVDEILDLVTKFCSK